MNWFHKNAEHTCKTKKPLYARIYSEFTNIEDTDGVSLLSTLNGLLGKGEGPTFEIFLKDDWTIAAEKVAKPKPYMFDMTKGVKIVFVGELTIIVTYEKFYNPSYNIAEDYVDSKEYFWITRDSENKTELLDGIRFEISDSGAYSKLLNSIKQ